MRSLARLVATSLYRRRVHSSENECLIVDSVEMLDALARDIPEAFRDSVDELERRLP